MLRVFNNQKGLISNIQSYYIHLFFCFLFAVLSLCCVFCFVFSVCCSVFLGNQILSFDLASNFHIRSELVSSIKNLNVELFAVNLSEGGSYFLNIFSNTLADELSIFPTFVIQTSWSHGRILKILLIGPTWILEELIIKIAWDLSP